MNWYKNKFSQLVKLPQGIDSDIEGVLEAFRLAMKNFPSGPPKDPILLGRATIRHPYNDYAEEDISFFLNNEPPNEDNGQMIAGVDRNTNFVYINYLEGFQKDSVFRERRLFLRQILMHELVHYFDQDNKLKHHKLEKLKNQNHDTSWIEYRAILRQVYEQFKNYYTILNREERIDFLRLIINSPNLSMLRYKQFEFNDPTATDKIQMYITTGQVDKLRELRKDLYNQLTRIP